MKTKKKRVQLDMTPRQYARLEKLTDDTDAASHAETIRRSLEIKADFVWIGSQGMPIYAEHPVTGEKILLQSPKRP